MEYDINRIEFAKTQKTKFIIQTCEHIFQICIDCIVKSYFFIMFLHVLWNFYLLRCLAFAKLNCFCVLLTLMCL